MKRQDTGFTLVELVLAMAVFSFMLVIVTTGYIQLMRVYQAGLASRTTQQNARAVLDGMEQVMRTAGSAWTNASPGSTICFSTGPGVIEYAVYPAAPGLSHDLYQRTDSTLTPGNCPVMTSTAGWAKLNDSSVSVSLFQTQTTDSVAGSYGTAVVTMGMAARSLLTNVVVTTDPDITKSTLSCTPGTGAQFCATTTLSTAGVLRGNSL